MDFSAHGVRIGLASALLIGVGVMYFILGGCEESKNRSCVGAMLAINSAVAGAFDQYCKDGGNPKRDAYLQEINRPAAGWITSRKCPKGGTYKVEGTDSTDMDSPKAYRVVCSVHGDLAHAKTTIDKETYDRLRKLLPEHIRPD